MIRVVIVEDEEFIRRGLVHTMDWLGMGCVVVGDACDGEEGLSLIKELKPDVVISDIRMPVVDGILMIKQALEFVDFRSILLTSYAEFEYAKRAIEIRVSSYLLKPVAEEDIVEAMEKIKKELQQKSFQSDGFGEGLMEEIDRIMGQESEKNYYVVKSLEKIVEHYGDRISIETVAEELGVSASYLSRKFKEITRRTFLEILNEYRVVQSVKLLSSGKYRVGEVADKTGFSDYKHFYSVFKKYTGVTPSEFTKG